MATTKKKEDPITVVFDPPDLGEPDNVHISEPTMDDFRKVDARIKPPRDRSKPVGKRPTVESELQRCREELDRNVSLAGLLIAARDSWSGQLVLLNKDKQIDNWIEVMRINPTIRNAVLKAMDMGVYATAITGSLALVIAVLAKMGTLPNSELILDNISGAGVIVPTDENVMMTDIMFGRYDAGENGSGSAT